MHTTKRPRVPRFRVVLYQDGEWICGQALEFDLSVQGRDVPKVYRKMHRAVIGHVAVRLAHGLRPFADLPPAAQKFHDMYEASRITLPEQIIRFPESVRVTIPPPRVRVAVGLVA
jgi:hypothetical protein